MKQEQKFRWHRTLQKAAKEDPNARTKLSLCVLARNWETCAVGEALADIGIHKDQLRLAKGNILYHRGAFFTKMIRAGRYREALLTLRIIRSIVSDNKEKLHREAALGG